jgi:hypothetical protein
MIFADRKYDFVYAMRLSPCAGCGSCKFIGRDLYTVMGCHESLTFFEGDRLCRALGSRVPLFTLLPRETVRKGSRTAFEASILDLQSSEIGLLPPVSSTFGASARSQSGLFGQSQKRSSRKPGESFTIKMAQSVYAVCTYEH